MKIALLTKEFQESIYGGAGIHVHHLHQALQKSPNLSVKIIPITSEKKHEFTNNIAQDIDIIHCHTWYTFSAGIQIKTQFKKQLILTFHSVEKKRPWKINQVGLQKHLEICELEQSAAKMADGIIAVSHQCKQDIIECYGILENKIHVIYNGVDSNIIDNSIDQRFLDTWNIDTKKPSILVINRISHQKDIKFLFKCLEKVDEKWQMILCLNSPDDEQIANFTMAQIQKLRPPVIWIDRFISQNLLSSLYQIADVFISTALYEPFGLTTAEAILHHCPVIARDAGGIREIMTQANGGILCPLDMTTETFSRIIDSFLDKNTRKYYQERIQANELWLWDKVATETSKIYLNALKHQ